MATLEKRKVNKTEGNVKQRKLAQRVAKAVREGEDITKVKLLQEAGYSRGIAEQPSRVLNSLGYKAELAKLGLTQELVVPMLVQDLENNPSKRWLGLSIAGKWLGLEKKGDDAKPQMMAINNAIIVIEAPKQ